MIQSRGYSLINGVGSAAAATAATAAAGSSAAAGAAGAGRRGPAGLPLLTRILTSLPLLVEPAGSVLATVPAGQAESIFSSSTRTR